jgi:hypothetical protein
VNEPESQRISHAPAAFLVPRLNAYARFKILLIHLAQNKIDLASGEYASLQHDFPQGQPGAGFAEMAKAFWDTYQTAHNLAGGCTMTRTYADLHQSEIIAMLDFTWHGNQSPGAYGETKIETYICPFE